MIEPGFTSDDEIFALLALTIAMIAVFGLSSALWAIFKGRKTLSMKTWTIFYFAGTLQVLFLFSDEILTFQIFYAINLSLLAALTMVGLVSCHLNRWYFAPPVLVGFFWIATLTFIEEDKLEGIPFWIGTFIVLILGVFGFLSFFILANRHKTPSAFIEIIGFIFLLLGEAFFLLHYVSSSSFLLVAGFAELIGIIACAAVTIGLFEFTTWKDLEIGRM